MSDSFSVAAYVVGNVDVNIELIDDEHRRRRINGDPP